MPNAWAVSTCPKPPFAEEPRPSWRVLMAAGGRIGAAHAEADREPAAFRLDLLPPASPAFVSEAGKQKTTPKDRSDSLICLKKIGAGEGIRTLDPDLGKVVLYP